VSQWLIAMDEELTCPVCHELFESPVVLNCAHHVCQSHVEELKTARKGGGGSVVECRVCREVTDVETRPPQLNTTLRNIVDYWRENRMPGTGSEIMEVAEPACGMCNEEAAVSHCRECGGILCQTCIDTTHKKGFLRRHTLQPLADTEVPSQRMFCDDHPDEKLNLYCLQCRVPVCAHCLLVGSHEKHERTALKQAYDQGQATLQQWLEQLSSKQDQSKKYLDKLSQLQTDIEEGGARHRELIEAEIEALKEQLDLKKQQLLSKSEHEQKRKKAALTKELDDARADGARLDKLQKRTQKVLKFNSEHCFLALCLPVIQDLRTTVARQVPHASQVDPSFPDLTTDYQSRSLAEMDLGPSPPRTVAPMVSMPRPVNTDASQVFMQGMAGNYYTQQGPVQPGYAPAAPGGSARPVYQAAPAYQRSFVQQYRAS